MTGKVGLALGAGSTKGYAHIGVLQVLEENRIPIDMISGCSIGSIIAGIYAAGTDLHLLEKLALELDIKSMLDVGKLTAGGLIRGDKIEELIGLLTHQKQIPDTKIPLFVIAADAGSGELVIFRNGPVKRAVRASMSIPAIFTPVEIDGRYYVDGGVIERVPCGLLREEGADVVISVDVGYTGGEIDVAHMNAYEMINRSIDIMQWHMTKAMTYDSDILLMPQVLYVRGHFDTKSAKSVIDEGRRVAEEALPSILALLKEKGIPLRDSAR